MDNIDDDDDYDSSNYIIPLFISFFDLSIFFIMD